MSTDDVLKEVAKRSENQKQSILDKDNALRLLSLKHATVETLRETVADKEAQIKKLEATLEKHGFFKFEHESLVPNLRKVFKALNDNKEEIVKAFIAKHGVQPDECEIIEQRTNTGTKWWVQKRERIEPDKNKWTQVPQNSYESRTFQCNTCGARRAWNNLGHLCYTEGFKA